MSSVLQKTFTPSKATSNRSHNSHISLSSQRKVLNLKHSPIKEEIHYKIPSSSNQEDVSLVQVGGLNLGANGLPDAATNEAELRKDEEITKKSWCGPVSTRESAYPLDESIIDASPERGVSKLQIQNIGSIKKPEMTSNQKRGTVAYRKATDPTFMKQSLTNYGGANYMSPPMSPRTTMRSTLKSKTATKLRGNGAKEQSERLRLGYSGNMGVKNSQFDQRDHVLGFVSPDLRETIHSPRVNQKLDFDDQTMVKTITNYYSTKEQDQIHIQGLYEQIKQLEMENGRLGQILNSKENELSTLG